MTDFLALIAEVEANPEWFINVEDQTMIEAFDLAGRYQGNMETITRLTAERETFKTAAVNAAATIAAFYEWFDRVEKAGGATSISGVAACNAMLKSMRNNRKRTFDLVVAPVQAALATPAVSDAERGSGQ